MSFHQLLQDLQSDTLTAIQSGFRPELALCATIVLMLLIRIPRVGRKLNMFYVALAGSLVGLYFSAPWTLLSGLRESEGWVKPEIFTGLLVYDELTVYFRSVLMLFAVLFVIFTRLSGIPDREDSPDFYTLVLGATVGMCLMASANHLLIVFLAVEMASVPSYALAGLLKGRRKSSEAALKYSVYGAGAAGVMLYGISLLAGALGSVHLPTMAQQLATLPAEVLAERQTVLLMGGLFVMVGLAFKLSAVPFHFWCPDVFEGASAEVNAFLSVASKAAALALLIRVALGFSHLPEATVTPSASQSLTAHDSKELDGKVLPDKVARRSSATRTVAFADEHGPASPETKAAPPEPTKAEARQVLSARLAPARRFIMGMIALIAAITCTFGNLAAYGQTNVKRLLAYSTIAHAGYMMMPIAAAVALSGDKPELAEQAIAALALYVGIYLFMNLGAFAIVAFLRNEMRSEEIADYAGLLKRCPGLVLCFSAILFSLLGLPPLAGFYGKLAAFLALASNTSEPTLLALLVIGGLNTFLSLFYYLRLIKVMTLDPEPEQRLPVQFSMLSLAGVFVAAVTAPVVLLGIWADPLTRWAKAAAAHLLS